MTDFFYFIHNTSGWLLSRLFLVPSYCSVLLHVVTNLICIFLVFRQLVLLSSLPRFLRSFCGQKGCTHCYSEKFNLDRFSRLSFFFLAVQISLPCRRMARDSLLYSFILESFCIKVSLKVCRHSFICKRKIGSVISSPDSLFLNYPFCMPTHFTNIPILEYLSTNAADMTYCLYADAFYYMLNNSIRTAGVSFEIMKSTPSLAKV